MSRNLTNVYLKVFSWLFDICFSRTTLLVHFCAEYKVADFTNERQLRTAYSKTIGNTVI